MLIPSPRGVGFVGTRDQYPSFELTGGAGGFFTYPQTNPWHYGVRKCPSQDFARGENERHRKVNRQDGSLESDRRSECVPTGVYRRRYSDSHDSWIPVSGGRRGK